MRRLMLTTIVVLTASGALAQAAGAPRGALTQLPKSAGCFIDPTQVSAGDCAKAKGMGSTQNVVITPDGRNVYSASNFTWGLVAFKRDKKSGRLTQQGCFSAEAIKGCTPSRGTVWAFWAAVAPDGRDVYVSGGIGYAIAHFRRNTTTGALTQPAGASACVRNRDGGTSQGGPSAAQSGCRLVDDLHYPRTITLSPDGRFLYAAAFDGDNVQTFARDASTGDLSPVAGGCLSSRAKPGCGKAAQLDGATDIVLSKDGRFAYVTAFRAGAVDVFTRDPATGLLAQLPGGCVASKAGNGCVAARGMKGAYNVALSPDQRSLYVASRNSAAIAVFDRDPATGQLNQKAGTAGCLSSKSDEGCGPARGMAGARGVTVAPDGHSVYTGSFTDSALAVFSRAANGTLHQLAGASGCIASSAKGCTRGRAVKHVWGIAVSADNRFVYSGVGGDRNSGLAIFSRRP